ncbi:MAG: hypothetical protein HC903_20285 [Methylacidiphilales bacterium]|nr:hypothetical protein [Candidatus Methylacidiphilales bacterium]
MPGFNEYDAPQEPPKANDERLVVAQASPFQRDAMPESDRLFFQTSPNRVAGVT